MSERSEVMQSSDRQGDGCGWGTGAQPPGKQ